MIEKTLAKRYATALLAVTNREGRVEETESALLSLKEAWQKDGRFRLLLGSPKVPRAGKKELLRKILGASSPALREFFDLLVDKNRTALIPDLADMYDRLADAFQGIVRVHVRSAYPLSEDQKTRIRTSMDRVTGKTCSVEASVDRSLRGGLQLKMGDSIMDGTVAYRLKRLGEKLQELQKR